MSLAFDVCDVSAASDFTVGSLPYGCPAHVLWGKRNLLVISCSGLAYIVRESASSFICRRAPEEYDKDRHRHTRRAPASAAFRSVWDRELDVPMVDWVSNIFGRYSSLPFAFLRPCVLLRCS